MRRPSGGRTLLLIAGAVACGQRGPSFRSGAALLFYQGLPTGHQAGLSWAPDSGHSRLLGFDEHLKLTRVISSPRLSQPVAVSPLGPDLLVTERLGDGVVLDTVGRPVREWSSPPPDVASLYASNGREVVAARSPYFVPLLHVEADTAPLVRVLDTLGHTVAGLATVRVPSNPFLAGLVNAGAVAVDSAGTVFFAPFARDEIRAYEPGGALRWTARRGIFPKEQDPVYETHGSDVRAHFGVATLALAVHGSRLYVLGSRDSTATRRRLDVLDAATGAILDTRTLGDTDTAVAVDERGRVTILQASRIVDSSAVAFHGREPFTPAFALPDTAGDTTTLATFADRVTLVNFWASWCDPCREEFPHMAQLYREFPRADFQIAAISDDVDSGRMLAFIHHYRPPFPILVGGGRMRATYHYRGLPYSVLLDRKGRIVERIFGFGGPAEFQQLRETIAKEIAVR